MDLTPLYRLFDLPPTSPAIASTLSSLVPPSSSPPSQSSTTDATSTNPTSQIPEPEIVTYPDASYHNYHSLGISLCFLPSPTSTFPLSKGKAKMVLDSVDLYNPLPAGSSVKSNRKQKLVYSPAPLPVLHFPNTSVPIPPPPASTSQPSRPTSNPTTSTPTSIKPSLPDELTRELVFQFTAQTTGKDLVQVLGEPTRKGGGQGWVDVWLEWSSVPLLPVDNVDDESTPTPTLTPTPTPAPAPTSRSMSTAIDKTQPQVNLGFMVHLRDPKGEDVLTDEQRRNGIGGIWDRAAGWEWSSLKVFKG